MTRASIVVPTYNRAAGLLETLTNLVRANPEPGWEAVVVDDGSTDGTGEAFEGWAQATGAPARLISQPNAGPAAARNAGALAAAGDVLIFIDDDMTPAEGFIARHLSALSTNPGCWIVGRIVMPAGIRRTPFGRYRDDLLEAFHGAHDARRPSPTEGVTANNLSMPKRDFLALGGFDEDFTIASSEDWELGMRARGRGIRILYDPQIVAVHEDWAVDLERFCERQRLYSFSDVLLVNKYGDDSPRSALVAANNSIRWGREPVRMSVKKAGKAIMATRAGRAWVMRTCRVAERTLGDSATTRRCYRTAVAIATFQGVRQGLAKYGEPGSSNRARRDEHRVLHLIDANGDTEYFRSIASRANRTCYPVTIGSMASAGRLQEAMDREGVESFSLVADERIMVPVAVLRLAQLLRRRKVSVLHAHCFEPTIVGLVAARIARTKFVFTRHHSDHHIRAGKRWHTRIDRLCARRADHVIAVSDATRRIMVDVEGVPEAQITVVLNGFEPLATPDSKDVQARRDELGAGDRPICLTIARLHEEKGHVVLLRALATVFDQAGPVLCAFAGDGPHREQIEHEAEVLGVTDSIRFLGYRRDIAELIAASDVVVLPSLAESFGFAAVEATSLGRPVVASDAGGLAEVVEDGVTGIVVPRGDSGALASAIVGILTDPDRAAELGAAGRRRAAMFDAERMVRSYEQVYDMVLSDVER